MALKPHISYLTATTLLDKFTERFDSGFLRVYSGTQPADADTGLAGNTLLAEFTFGANSMNTAFQHIAAGPIGAPTCVVAASGTASWFRVVASDGTTVIFDGSIGQSTDYYSDLFVGSPFSVSFDAVLSSTSLLAGQKMIFPTMLNRLGFV